MGRIKKKDCSKTTPKICQGATLREESSGKKDHDLSSILKLKHLQKLATWAVEAGIAPLGALFGHHLAATAESSGIPIARSCFQCERCESILQPGFNCTIRIEKNKHKQRKAKASMNSFQNNVVYKCNYCSHHNIIRGTKRGHLKDFLLSRGSGHDRAKDSTVEKLLTNRTNCVANVWEPNTPLQESDLKRKKEEKKSEELQLSGNSGQLMESGKQSSRKKRRGWSSLKDIVERKEADDSCKKIANFVIPFVM